MILFSRLINCNETNAQIVFFFFLFITQYHFIKTQVVYMLKIKKKQFIIDKLQKLF